MSGTTDEWSGAGDGIGGEGLIDVDEDSGVGLLRRS